MRLQRAIPIDAHDAQDGFSGFEGPEERAARKARRKARRVARKSRKLKRIQKQTQQARRQAGAGKARGRKKSDEARLQPLSTALPRDEAWNEEAELEPASWEQGAPWEQDGAWPEEDPAVLDADWSEAEEALDEELEGIGAFRPLQRFAQRRPMQQLRAKAQARRAARQASPVSEPAGWGPSVRLGQRLRIQAAQGHRAAVIDLKPGLFLVAEIPAQAIRPEFGVVPLLAPLMVRAAKKALDAPPEGPQRPGPLAALFRRRPPGKAPVRLFEARPAPAAPAPLALPGPAQAPAPATAGSFLLPAPNVGWADDQDVAEVMGCEACDRCRR